MKVTALNKKKGFTLIERMVVIGAAGAARGNKLNILGHQALGKLIKPGLIRNGKQGTLNSCCLHD